MSTEIETVTRYPLDWPVGHARTRHRSHARFKVSSSRAMNDLRDEIARHCEDKDFVISTNIELRLDGTPKANRPSVSDPGVAVYFRRKSKTYVVACDSYLDVYDNARAISKTLEAMRAIERYGCGELLERAYSGFLALQAAIVADPPWWETLGVERYAGIGVVKAAFRSKVIRLVPALESSGNIEHDSAGHEVLVQLNRAYAAAKSEVLQRP